MNLMHNIRCILLPVNNTHFLGQLGIIGHLAFILGDGLQGARFQSTEGFQQQFCPHVGQPFRQLTAAFPRQNVHAFLHQHRPCIHPTIHQHGGDACLFIPLQNAPGNGGTAPVARQEGGMDVHVAQGRNVQQLLGQNLPEGRRNAQIRGQGLQFLHAFLADALGLIHRNAPAKGFLLHRGRGQFVAPSPGAIRLGVNADHVIACIAQGGKAGHSKVRRAHKNDSHSACSSSASSSGT